KVLDRDGPSRRINLDDSPVVVDLLKLATALEAASNGADSHEVSLAPDQPLLVHSRGLTGIRHRDTQTCITPRHPDAVPARFAARDCSVLLPFPQFTL